jgi:hypothetical protein
MHQHRIKVMIHRIASGRKVAPVLDQFPKYHMKMLLADFNAYVGREFT